ncbi:MAG TPA: SPFH domain-containing protein, partial [Nannocystis sp.]
MILIAAAVALVPLLGVPLAFRLLFRRIDEGTALIISSPTDTRAVLARGALVLPILHRAETMDVTLKKIVVDCRGKDGIHCRDSIRADVRMVFLLRVNRTAEDVLKVASTLGCAKAGDVEVLTDLFTAKFTEAMKTAAKKLNFDMLCAKREQFKDEVIDIIGVDLNGFLLEDAAIEILEQTPIELLDPQNLLDAEGIRKITERTARENIRANELRQQERMTIARQTMLA